MATVLLVENDVITREDIADTLRDHGYDVLEAGNGRDALARLDDAAEPPILILLDLSTPVMNGWEFRREQRAHPRHHAVPIAIMSGNSELTEHARELEAFGYLKKPFDLGTLLKLLSEAANAANSR